MLHKKILITGATGAIGRALATAYAAPNTTLILQGRNATILRGLEADCVDRGANTVIAEVDLSCRMELTRWLDGLNEIGVPDLLIVNAGININNTNNNPQTETWDEIEILLEVNIRAAFAIVNHFLPAMLERRQGQIALISSLAAFHGLPMTPSYCASKAALKAYGEGLRAGLAKEGIKVNVVMPGYVASPMSDAMPGPKPFMISSSDAAVRIKKGLMRNQPRITFPFPLNIATWLLGALPAALSQRLLHIFGYR